MLDTMFQHPDMVQYALFLAMFYARVCLFKESTFILVGQAACIYLGKFEGDQDILKDVPTF